MRFIIGLLFTTLLFNSCNVNESEKALESTSEGTISITAEESFKPFVEEELKVFASSYPNAKDSIFTLKDLHDRLVGINPQKVVMDGNHLTGIVRFLIDSLVKSDKLGKNVMAANGSKEVIEYLKNNPNAIGFVGMNWIGDKYDPSQVSDRLQLKMGKVECTLCAEKGLFASPSQATISLGQYSLSLPIYYILKENAPGLGSGLLNFMSLERGQLIFRRSFLVPAKMGFQKRNGLMN